MFISKNNLLPQLFSFNIFHFLFSWGEEIFVYLMQYNILPLACISFMKSIRYVMIL